MDKVRVLSDIDSELLHEFSRRSLARLKLPPLLAVISSFFSSYLDANIGKEVEKDRLIIEEAAAAFHAGRPFCDIDLEDIFEKTKAIDRKFIEAVSVPSFSINPRYSDFADIRIKRIGWIANAVYRLLANWQDTVSFSQAVRNAYTGEEFGVVLREILHLYNLETRILSEAVHSPFRKTITVCAEVLYADMESAADELAGFYTDGIFGDRTVNA